MQESVKKRREIPLRYLAITVFCFIVSVIYGRFSHGIHSFWMQYLALWPLILGLIPALLAAAGIFPFWEKRVGETNESSDSRGLVRRGQEAADGPVGRAEVFDEASVSEVLKDIYRFGIAAVTVSSFLKGVLEIAGTDSVYPSVLLYAGAVMLLCGAVGVLVFSKRKKHNRKKA